MSKWRRKLSKPKRWAKAHLVKKYGSICYICDVAFKSMKEITIDHYVPVSKGGMDVLDNYRLAHYHCNRLKGSIPPEQFNLFQDIGILESEDIIEEEQA